MPRVKPQRETPTIDMTAMSDMAWLLLTFFILTTTFRKPEIVPVTTPSSVSTEKVQDGDMVQITVNKDGKYYFSIIDDRNKLPVLEKMGEKYKITFNEAEQKQFMELSEVTVPIGQLKQFLNLNKGEQQTTIPGIPLDSTDLQLIDWVEFSYDVDDQLKLAIKGDMGTEYPDFKELINQLVEKKFNRFQLITSAESKPED